MNENAKKLLELIQARPDLPIVPMVWEEVVAECASCYWRGSFGTAHVDKYWTGDEWIYFYDEDDIEGAINDPACKFDPDTLTDELALEIYRSLPWTEAIVVYIEMPD